MGIALELSRLERESIAREVLKGELVFKGDKIGSHCPFHPEKTPGGAFFYDLETDTGRCHSCGEWGDLLSIWNIAQGRQPNDSDGYREFVKAYMKDGAPTAKAKKAAKRMGPPPEWKPQAYDLPPVRWSEKAGAFVDECNARLLRDDALLEQLFAWGITPATVAALKIGWNDGEKDGEPIYRKYSHWGLPPVENQNGNEKCVQLAQGFVFPGYRGAGEERRLISAHIRLANPGEKDPKYKRIVGSGNHYYVFGSPRWKIWAVVETVRDAMLLWQELAPLEIGAVAVGGATICPDETVHKILSRAELVSNCVDTDNSGSTNSWHYEPWNPGKFAWMAIYPNAIRLPVPSAIGKDVGDLPSAGVSVWDWFSAGLPEHIVRRLDIRREALAREDGGTEGGAGNEAAQQAEDGGAVDQPEQQVAASHGPATPPARWEAPRARRGVRYLPMPAAARVGNGQYEYIAEELAKSGSALLLEVEAGKVKRAVWPTNASKVGHLDESMNMMLRDTPGVAERIAQALKEAA